MEKHEKLFHSKYANAGWHFNPVALQILGYIVKAVIEAPCIFPYQLEIPAMTPSQHSQPRHDTAHGRSNRPGNV